MKTNRSTDRKTIQVGKGRPTSAANASTARVSLLTPSERRLNRSELRMRDAEKAALSDAYQRSGAQVFNDFAVEAILHGARAMVDGIETIDSHAPVIAKIGDIGSTLDAQLKSLSDQISEVARSMQSIVQRQNDLGRAIVASAKASRSLSDRVSAMEEQISAVGAAIEFVSERIDRSLPPPRR